MIRAKLRKPTSPYSGCWRPKEERRCSKNMEEKSAQNKLIETAFRPEQAMETLTSQKTLAGWHQKDKGPMEKKWYETVEEEKLQSKKGRHSTVRRFL